MLTETTSRLATASRSAIRTYKGIGVSPGIAIGRAVIIERREAAIYRVPIRDDEVPSEVNRFLEALEKTQTQLHDLKQKVRRSMGEEYAQIFEAHAMMVSDPSFADKVSRRSRPSRSTPSGRWPRCRKSCRRDSSVLMTS